MQADGLEGALAVDSAHDEGIVAETTAAERRAWTRTAASFAGLSGDSQGVSGALCRPQTPAAITVGVDKLPAVDLETA